MDAKIEIITIDDSRYPQHLREIPRAPQQLYCIGNTDLLQQRGIAVVGTRRCSPYGRWVAYELGRKIAACGVTVVSGMAEGIDSRGHWGCLDGGGNTIAVLGTGVDICFPKSNGQLYKTIAEKGLLVSEFKPGDRAASWSFPERNRIISGLSRSVIVVEGAVKSGSMITANLALTQGRDVFAVPGNINQPNSVGVNMLIRDGAMPILSIDEAPELLGIHRHAFEDARVLCSPEEAKLLECAKFSPGIETELAAYQCGIAPADANVLVMAMELKGLIRREGTRMFMV